MIKICHIISGLNLGGAEMMLYKLLCNQNRELYDSWVVSLIEIGSMGERIQRLGIPVYSLGMSRSEFGVNNLKAVIQLAGFIKQYSPDIVQTWMYHADLLGGIIAKLTTNIPIIWGIRHSNLETEVNKRTTIWTAKTCSYLSYLIPNRIACCSKVAREIHIKLGYAADKIKVIPNGFDCEIFQPDLQARLSICEELEILPETILIGLVARFHPQKDHYNFVQAAAKIHTQFPKVHFLLCGKNNTWDNFELVNWLNRSGIRHSSYLLGERQDIPRVIAALDIMSSSSCGEGFPNVIGEAMACGVPCVVTDVGDSKWLVDDTGRVVPPRDSQALANAWKELIDSGKEERTRLGQAARTRIIEKFSLDSVVRQYESLYETVLA